MWNLIVEEFTDMIATLLAAPIVLVLSGVIAGEASTEGSVVTLHDIGASTLNFSDRPKREVGHATYEMFVDMWDEGENSFQDDSLNAAFLRIHGTGRGVGPADQRRARTGAGEG